MNDQNRKYKIKETFNVASAGYDKPALRFFRSSAEHLANQMRFEGRERILDVATGTGAVALACAKQLVNGHVTGIDLSDGMLKQASSKAALQHLDNLTFHCMDLEAMPFPPAEFDDAVCGFGIFFMPDMEAALRCIASVIKPGGRIGISSFTGDMMEPMSQKFVDRLQIYGIEMPPLSWKRLDDAEKHQSLFAMAGITQVETRSQQVGYFLTGFDEWWDILWNSGFRGMLSQLSEKELTRFKEDHFAELQSDTSDEGLWLNVEVLISVGIKPN
ncbi:class I SAM-dependent methyltransferase [Sulfurirhabdus autotrophica]|uniref:Methyltransferase family protein n=1 Tax=Sulfurirhabdus autotrophica TaxID=1706046 RepID=A0A4R3YAN3_9PROT|nr:class I SAM-dependent methyltransferase [Sulfurirhabdus autotrophica]TCV88980.1 methyltransferase family protein [Sulfurirhabdus autotrophica]